MSIYEIFIFYQLQLDCEHAIQDANKLLKEFSVLSSLQK
jgi:hypothetical protein